MLAVKRLKQEQLHPGREDREIPVDAHRDGLPKDRPNRGPGKRVVALGRSPTQPHPSEQDRGEDRKGVGAGSALDAHAERRADDEPDQGEAKDEENERLVDPSAEGPEGGPGHLDPAGSQEVNGGEGEQAHAHSRDPGRERNESRGKDRHSRGHHRLHEEERPQIPMASHDERHHDGVEAEVTKLRDHEADRKSQEKRSKRGDAEGPGQPERRDDR